MKNAVLVSTLLAVALQCLARADEPRSGEPKSGVPISVTGSGYFQAAQKYHEAIAQAVSSGHSSQKHVELGMSVQRALDIAVYDPTETSRIVGVAANSIAIDDARGTLSSEHLLKKVLLMQQVQISQNKVMIRLLTEIAHSDRQAPSKHSNISSQ